MRNSLFIVCPFSYMESFLQSNFGKHIYFLTCSATVLPMHEYEYISEVKGLIMREKIKTIYFVNDTSCIFINRIIQKNKLTGLPSEKEIEELYIEHYSKLKKLSLFNQQMMMAELNIHMQVDKMLNSSLFLHFISDLKIEIKGLITSKEKNLLKEFATHQNTVHEF